MRYTFVNNGEREASFKRCYRRFLILLGIGLSALIVLCLVFPGYMGTHAWVVLPFLGYFIAFALYDRSLRKRDGVEPAEWWSYVWRQPLMIVVMVIMAISTVVHFYQVFFAK